MLHMSHRHGRPCNADWDFSGKAFRSDAVAKSNTETELPLAVKLRHGRIGAEPCPKMG